LDRVSNPTINLHEAPTTVIAEQEIRRGEQVYIAVIVVIDPSRPFVHATRAERYNWITRIHYLHPPTL